MLTLKVDTQEYKKFLYLDAYLEAVKGKHRIKEYTVERLATGDHVTSDGYLGVERKAEDFLSSLYGNLKQQLKELRDNYEHAYLFVEFNGPDHLIEHFNVEPEIITGGIASILSHCHVPIIFVGSLFIPILFKTIDKAYDGKDVDYEAEYSPIRRVATKKEFNFNIIESAYHGFGISRILAKRIMKHFNSPQAVFNSSIEDLQEVPGIGKIKAEKMYYAIRKEGK